MVDMKAANGRKWSQALKAAHGRQNPQTRRPLQMSGSTTVARLPYLRIRKEGERVTCSLQILDDGVLRLVVGQGYLHQLSHVSQALAQFLRDPHFHANSGSNQS